MKTLIVALTALVVSEARADICGPADNRLPSHDPRVARFTEPDQFSGCAATLISKNCIVTTGTCANIKENAEFNVPLSIAGVPQRAAPEDTYTIDYGFLIGSRGGIGEEWAVTKLSPNFITGKSAGEVQGYFKIVSQKPKKNDPIKVIQYSHTLNTTHSQGEILHYAQTVSEGKVVKASLLLSSILEHNADTLYGASGAPIINAASGELIGINTHAGCNRSANAGTSIWGNAEFKKAITSCINSDK